MKRQRRVVRVVNTAVAMVFLTAGGFCLAAEDYEQEQQRLDQACEDARQKKLAPERERYIEECVAEKQKPDRAACEKFYADYGNQSGNRAPLYLDLPECVKAFEFRQNN